MSSWCAVPAVVGDHVPPCPSVFTFHNQVDPLASTSPSCQPASDLFSLSSHFTIRSIPLPPTVHLASPPQIFSLCLHISQSGRSPCLHQSILSARLRSFLSVFTFHNQVDPLASTSPSCQPASDLFSLSSHFTIRSIPLPPPVHLASPPQIFSLCLHISQSGRSPCLHQSILPARLRSFLSVLVSTSRLLV